MNPKWRTSSFWQWNLVIKEFIQNPHPKKWKFKTRLKRPFSGTFLLTNFPTPSSASRRSFLWQPQRAKTIQDWEIKIGTGKQREDHNIPAQISKRSMLASNRLYLCVDLWQIWNMLEQPSSLFLCDVPFQDDPNHAKAQPNHAPFVSSPFSVLADYQQQRAGPVGRGWVPGLLGWHSACEGRCSSLCLFLSLGWVVIKCVDWKVVLGEWWVLLCSCFLVLGWSDIFRVLLGAHWPRLSKKLCFYQVFLILVLIAIFNVWFKYIISTDMA